MGRSHPVLLRAIAAIRHLTQEHGEAVLAVSGGADSLALAGAASVLHRRGEREFRAVVVDHRLQEGSAQAAETARAQCEQLGLPAQVLRVRVNPNHPGGLEEAARIARYDALTAPLLAQSVGRMALSTPQNAIPPTLCGRGEGRTPVLTAHTASDQAEQVLLALMRGSGTQALAGIPVRGSWRGTPLLRPFLPMPVREAGPRAHELFGLTREDTEAICAHLGLAPWQDPTNLTPDRPRTRARLELLPALEVHQPGTAANLARTAALAADDADFLAEAARLAFEEARAPLAEPDGVEHSLCEPSAVALSIRALRALHPALSTRVIRLAAAEASAGAASSAGIPAPPLASPTRERTAAVLALVAPKQQGGSDSPGPVQLPGGILASRARIPAGGGKMEHVLILSPEPSGALKWN